MSLGVNLKQVAILTEVPLKSGEAPRPLEQDIH